MVMKYTALVLIVAASASLAAEDSEMLLREAREQTAVRKFEEAHQLLSRVIKAAPELAMPYYIRGRVNFQRGKMPESVRDFDAYVSRQPAAAAFSSVSQGSSPGTGQTSRALMLAGATVSAPVHDSG